MSFFNHKLRVHIFRLDKSFLLWAKRFFILYCISELAFDQVQMSNALVVC